MTTTKYIVNGINCTTGEKIINVEYSIEDAMELLEGWIGWFRYYKDTRELDGSEDDFYIEKVTITTERFDL